MSAAQNECQSLVLAILTISDSRTRADDTSGDLLQACALDAGHQVKARHIVPDDRYQVRALVSEWIADREIQAVLTTGGTGLTGRDGTPEAILPLLDKCIDGFGELFRALSYQEIGTSTLQSRCLAGVANGTVVICMPGSTNACQLAWDKIIQFQLDSRTQPCNLVQLMPRFKE